MFDGTAKKILGEERGDYHYFGQYKCPLLYYALLQNWADPQDSSFSIPIVSGQIVVLDGHQFILKKDWGDIVRATTQALDSSSGELFKDFIAVAEHHTTALQEAVSTALRSQFDLPRFFTLVHHLQYPWFLVLPMAEAVEDWLKLRVPEEGLHHYFVPDKPTLYADYQSACRMAHTETDIEDILEKFAWVGYMHFWGDGNSREKVLEQTANLPVDSASTSHYMPPHEFREVYHYARRITYYRQHFAELCSLATLALKRFLDTRGIELRNVHYLTPDELLRQLDMGIAVLRAIVEERERGYGLFNSIVTGPELERLGAQLVDKIEIVDSIKGTVASKGIARGAVTIILSPVDMGKMKMGNILVAHETTPDLVSAMSSAAAIVTDVGGLTSHAAIASREMRKPCIIGTKVATQILHDGDLVEVDAEKGIVTILQRA